jgi:hypothetical protein
MKARDQPPAPRDYPCIPLLGQCEIEAVVHWMVEPAGDLHCNRRQSLIRDQHHPDGADAVWGTQSACGAVISPGLRRFQTALQTSETLNVAQPNVIARKQFLPLC